MTLIEHTKKRILMDALTKGLTSIIVNATKPGVKLPADLVGNPKVMLNLSWKFGTPMDLVEAGVSATLSFGGKEQPVFIPWKSIWIIKYGDDMHAFKDADPDDRALEVLTGGREFSVPRKDHLKLLN